jgi:hypothetical protein
MKKEILSSIFLFSILVSYSQSKESKLEIKLPYYIYNLNKNHSLDSTKQYILEFSCNRKRKIKNLNVFFSENNVMIKMKSDSFNNYSFDSLYIISKTERKKNKNKVLLFFIIKDGSVVKSPEYDKQFSSIDVEKIFSSFNFIQTRIKKFELLKPIIIYKEDAEY